MKYNFVGYGSLLSHNSLSKTIKDKKFIPVVVKGYKRIFDLIEDNKKQDCLNVIKSKKDFFNAIMFSINEKELTKIKEREDVYNLEDVEVYDFKSRIKLGKALISSDSIVGIDHKGLLPDRRYFILCREAAYHISKEFGKMWDKTTFTSKGIKISKWIKKHKGYDTIKNPKLITKLQIKLMEKVISLE